MRMLVGVLAAVVLILAAAWGLNAEAQAPKRVALVIGNAAYVNASRLANPHNDAKLVAAALKKAGFQTVEVKSDLGVQAMRTALRDFRAKAAGAEVAMVYYAGHGIEGNGRNWLLPTDAALASELDLVDEAIDLDRVLQDVSGADLRVVILDACRDNPFGRSWRRGSRAFTRGLGGVDADDVLVIYAAAPGQTASDGEGRNSPFAAALAQRLPQAGLPIQLLGGAVRDDVLKSTGETQRPFVSASITGTPFYLVPTAPGAPDPQAEAFRKRAEEAEAQLASLRRQQETAKPAPPPAPKPAAEPRPTPAPDARTTPAATRAPLVRNPSGLPDFALFRECDGCPEMVVIPAGEFTMGSPSTETGRHSDEDQVSVTLPRFALSRFPVTRGEYAAFVDATGRATPGGCRTDRATRGSWQSDPLGTWRDPAFAQTDRHPVVCVDWAEAEAYARWTKQRTSQAYRLVTEAEYEYANRGGRGSAYFWGGDSAGACDFANGADATLRRAFSDNTRSFNACDDGYERTSPVGSFAANPFGLFDTTGNVWSWTADCYVASHSSNPRNGQANTTGDCANRVVRGGSWFFNPQGLRSAVRGRGTPTSRDGNLGFRLARTL
jgi:formylglycine-generating enzyme required for sulfatase activity